MVAIFLAQLLHAQNRPLPPWNKKSGITTPQPQFSKGVVLIKFTKIYESLLASRNTRETFFGIGKLDSVLQKLGMRSSRQEFALLFDHAFNQRSVDNANRSYAAKNKMPLTAAILEQRHKEFGFHLWYRLQFDSSIYLNDVLAKLQSLKGIVAAAELVPRGQLFSMPDDPLYPNQHNLHNIDNPGKDIDIERAWNITTGDTNVIVAVNDGSISLDHEDLDGSIWFGKGFNFTDNTPLPSLASTHATAIAGIIAARTNNGKGISGIAGGNGTVNSGVKLMSCQIINGDDLNNTLAVAAFVYAADNGAAISNNSWGDYSIIYKDQASLADGVRYFTKYGGGAAMKGGLVVWAAGNYGIDIEFANTAMDIDGTIAVAATNNRDEKTSYSNYGNWVDISAPGGDVAEPGQGLTTTLYDPLTNLNGYIDAANGTSFAAPQVCGVAALVASVAPGRFTADEVMGIVLSTADNIDPLNPGYEGKLGSGRVNAYKAVLKAQQLAATPAIDTVSNVIINRTCQGYEVSYAKNSADNDVMIAYGLSRKFDLPNGNSYSVGDSIGKTAVVVYKGLASSFNINSILQDSAVHYIKIWSVNGTNYSSGTVYHTDSSYYTLRNPSAVQGASEVAISFGKACPNSDVLVVVNSLPQFGAPAGNLDAGDNIVGGATVLYKGSAAGFTHSGLSSGSYYYTLYPVVNNRYGQGKYLGGFCFGVTGVPLPLKTGFETPGVPPHFALLNPMQDGMGWQISNSAVGNTGTGVAFTNNFYNYQPSRLGEKSYLQTAPLDVTGADSIICRFAHAYRAYDTAAAAEGSFYNITTINYQDTLSLLISTDCGQTWQTVWERGGTDLSTTQPDVDFFNDGAPLVSSDWVNNKVNLTSFISAGTTSAIVAFRNTNRSGRNIYLDDINIYKVVSIDAGILKIISPDIESCNTVFSPKVVLENFGLSALTAVSIHYKLDNGATQTISWTGNKNYEQTDTIVLPAISTVPGTHHLTVFTSDPNMLADGVEANDSATVDFLVLPAKVITTGLTYRESFEDPNALPDGWRIADPQNAYTWQRVDNHSPLLPGFHAADDTSAMMVVTIWDEVIGAVHDLYTTPFSTGNADTVLLSFSRAAFGYLIPGSTNDRLDVLLTTDCGETFTNIYSKTGTELATSQDITQFEPLSAADWKSDTINITGLVRNASEYRFVFRVTNAYESNVFLDNVQLRAAATAVVLPLNLVRFTGRPLAADKALLSWRTSNEINTSYFELQRSTDGRNFSIAATLRARGNGQPDADYNYTDTLQPGLYYYRLRMVDRDGAQTYSQVISVMLKSNNAITVYPVPAKDAVWINGSNSNWIGKDVELMDIQGRLLKTIRISQWPQMVDVSSLAPATYLLKLPNATTVKVIKR